jgi:O-antigen/teichoic acid export membrane protein
MSFRVRLFGPSGPTTSSTSHLSQTFWTLLDQGFISLGTFLTTLILARNVVPDTYGRYVLIVGVMLFLNSLQNSLIGYPLILQASGLGTAQYKALVGSALQLSVYGAATLGLMLGTALAVFGSGVGLSVAAAFALFCWQVQLTSRNAFIAQLNYRGAFPGDFISYMGQAVAVLVAVLTFDMSLTGVFVIIAVTAFMGFLLQISQLRILGAIRPPSRPVVRNFLELGGWATLSTSLNSAGPLIFITTLGVFHGPEEIARYQAVVNVVGLTHPLMFSVGNLIIPAVALVLASGSLQAAGAVALKRSLYLGAPLILFLGLLLITAETVLRLFYGSGSEYVSLDQPLRWLAVAYVFFFIAMVLVSFLNGMRRPKSTFLSSVVGTSAIVTLGVPLSAGYGVVGATIGAAVSFVVWAIAAASILILRDAPGYKPNLCPSPGPEGARNHIQTSNGSVGSK